MHDPGVEDGGGGWDGQLFSLRQRAGWFITVTTCRIVCLQPIISTFQIVSPDRGIEINDWPQLHEEGHFDVCFQNQAMID